VTAVEEVRNQVVSSWFDCDRVIDLTRIEFESRIVLFYFSLIFFSFEESCLLVSWCTGGRYGMTCSDKNRGRSRRLDTEDQRWSHRPGTRWPGDREVGWRRVRSAPCTCR
jgi:hypothetical protein